MSSVLNNIHELSSNFHSPYNNLLLICSLALSKFCTYCSGINGLSFTKALIKIALSQSLWFPLKYLSYTCHGFGLNVSNTFQSMLYLSFSCLHTLVWIISIHSNGHSALSSIKAHVSSSDQNLL